LPKINTYIQAQKPSYSPCPTWSSYPIS